MVIPTDVLGPPAGTGHRASRADPSCAGSAPTDVTRRLTFGTDSRARPQSTVVP
jgi:hypothetical protein